MAEIDVSEDVRQLIGEIIARNNWKTIGEVKYYPATEAGDGYSSKHVAIEIPLKTGTFRLFAKYSLNLTPSENLPVNIGYENETYLYEKIIPAFQKFSQDSGVKGTFFDNVPMCYGTSPKFVIVLENLRNTGFRLYERTKFMDESHIVLVMKTFAKFHALSFAMKDQDKETYSRLLDEWDGDFLRIQKKDAPTQRMLRNIIAEAIQKFDREEDKRLREKCDVDELFELIMEAVRKDDEYSVFTQGDCWCNNMMFLYEGKINKNPIDVKLIDWQMLRPTSTVYDLAYFFFSVASPEDLKRHQYYLDVYYKELSDQIKQFGSNPELIYSKSVFQDEWKKYCRYGFAFGFILFKFMLAKKEDAPNMEDHDFESDNSTDIQIFATYSNEEEYIRRMRYVGEFLVDNDYI